MRFDEKKWTTSVNDVINRLEYFSFKNYVELTDKVYWDNLYGGSIDRTLIQSETDFNKITLISSFNISGNNFVSKDFNLYFDNHLEFSNIVFKETQYKKSLTTILSSIYNDIHLFNNLHAFFHVCINVDLNVDFDIHTGEFLKSVVDVTINLTEGENYFCFKYCVVHESNEVSISIFNQSGMSSENKKIFNEEYPKDYGLVYFTMIYVLKNKLTKHIDITLITVDNAVYYKNLADMLMA